MQIGGIGGSELNSHGISHQVTDCVHEHDTGKTKAGGMQAQAQTVSFSMQEEKAVSQEQVSLLDGLKEFLKSGRTLLGRIWGGSDSVAETPGSPLDQGDTEVIASLAAPATQQSAEAKVADNPYFTTHSDPGKVKESLYQKIRIRFHEAAATLTKRFGGESMNNAFDKNAKNGHRKSAEQDLRKKSRYRQDDLEIDCVLTDDSYLMDSYDRRGEYSTLSTENKHSN